MGYFEMPAGGGGGPHEPWCISCKGTIAAGQRCVRVNFNSDPHGHKGLSGLYHEQCSKPFASMARIINMNWFGGF